ncbi:MAG: cell envelope integrity protein TolA [Thiobacillus sp.]|nr:cell envelope integrity protein TolA [Thiobacillus sp.]
MNAPVDAPYLSRPGPNLAAGAMALGVHVLFALLLVFGVSWQTQHPAPVMVDVWDALPPLPSPAPRPKREVAPVPPEPARPPEPPKAETAPAPKAPDIALEKKKAEDERLRKLKAVRDADAKAQAEATRLEAEAMKKAREKQLADQRKKELLRQMEEDDMQQRMANEQAASEARLLKQAEARAAAARHQTEVDRAVGLHRDKISAKVRSNTRLPGTLKGNPEVRCLVRLLPTGEVQSVKVTQSSGNPAYDEAVVEAIEKSSPLPLPADREARSAFVPELSFVHRPKE